MNGRDDIDMTAAEYVLGTLDHAERTSVAARRQAEPHLDAAIRDWERRLAPLHDDVAPVEPPAGLLRAIEGKIASNGSQQAQTGVPQPSAVILTLERRVVRWRRMAVAASAIAASLLVAIGLRETLYPPKPQSFVAVFQQDDKQPAFVMSIDLATRELTIRTVTADRQIADKTYQLWIVSDQLGPAPRSLGLLDAKLEPTRKRLTEFEPALLQKATFGISLEQAGGSPTGRPASNAVHGRLYPATP